MKSIIKKIVPHIIKRIIKVKFKEYKKHKLKWKIIKYLEKDSEYNTAEKKEIIHFLKNNSFSQSIFPYSYVKKYNPQRIVVYTDNQCNMKYVQHGNKRLYFKRNWDEKAIKKYYNDILSEQDIDSPHKYETEKFHVQNNDVVVDAGVAEGNFAISIIEKVKKIYLFEVDEEWIEALKMTFAPWKEKVIIVNKYVSDNNENNCVRLDDFFENEKVDFLKADIEGAEIQMLKGSPNILSTNKPLKIIVCTYHKQNDAKDLNRMLTERGFQTEFSKGYVIYGYYDEFTPPYLRKVLIRASKNN